MIKKKGKLQTICANSAKRLMQLAQEWETHRRPLIDKLRDIKSSKTKVISSLSFLI